jgi:hypothetical protein
LTHLEAIAVDFAENRKRLGQAIDYTSIQIEAALRLREEARKPEPDLSVAQLNQLFSLISGLPTFEAVSFAYQNFTNSGVSTGMRNLELKKELTAFYTSYQLTELMQNSQELHYANILQPYAIRNLDYAAVMRPGGASDDERLKLEPLDRPELVLKVIKTQKFRNIVVSEWERAVDLQVNYLELLEHVEHIEMMLSE